MESYEAGQDGGVGAQEQDKVTRQSECPLDAEADVVMLVVADAVAEDVIRGRERSEPGVSAFQPYQTNNRSAVGAASYIIRAHSSALR